MLHKYFPYTAVGLIITTVMEIWVQFIKQII